MRSGILSVAASLVCAQDNEVQDRILFEAFKQDHGRAYDTAQVEEYRFQVFRDALRRIAAQNADPEDGAEYGVTRWSDRTYEENRKRCGSTCVGANCTTVTARSGVTGTQHAWDGTCYAKARFPEMCSDTLPNDLDWTTLGAVTPIKDQGTCGNCFTFGATLDMEAAWFLAGNDLVSLSEQQLTSCDTLGGDAGCGGGETNLDTDRYVSKHGITSEELYPYSTKTSTLGLKGTCDKSLEAQPVATFVDGYQISGGVKDCNWCNKQKVDEEVMKRHLATAGPLTIAINSNRFDNYKSGIMSPVKATCPGEAMFLDHQVAIVGYGSEAGVDYWKIRNSWGGKWGEGGYCRIIRGDNRCGVAADATHVVAPSSAPTPTPPAPTPPAPTPPAPTPPAPTPPAPLDLCKENGGKCTQRCLDWTIKTCPVDQYANYKKCFKCGDDLDIVDIMCPKEKDQEDCCHTLHDWAAESVVV